MTDTEIKIAVAEKLGKVTRLSDEEYATAMKQWQAEPEHPHASLTKPCRVKVHTDIDLP